MIIIIIVIIILLLQYITLATCLTDAMYGHDNRVALTIQMFPKDNINSFQDQKTRKLVKIVCLTNYP